MDNNTKIKAKKIIDRICRGWILQDLKRLIQIPVIPNSDGNCNFPIALFVLSCMDFLGYLTSLQELNSIGDTEKRIKTYIDLYFVETDKKALRPYMDDFVEVFRHGLSHEFFPKYGGISRTIPHVIWQKDDKLVLDADELSHAFIRSIDNLSDRLDQLPLAERVVRRYETKQNENKQRFIQRLISTSNNYSSNATISYDPNLIEKQKKLY